MLNRWCVASPVDDSSSLRPRTSRLERMECPHTSGVRGTHSSTRRTATLVAAAIAVAAVIGVTIFLSVRDDESSGRPTTLSGRWVVTRIQVGSSQPIAVPHGYGADFDWIPAGPQRVIGPSGGKSITKDFGPALDASDGISSYGCFYTRAGDVLTLTGCANTLNVPIHPTELQRTVSAAFDRAFRNAKMTVASTYADGLSVTLGDTVFTLVHAP
jgi:hypothetical protein